MQLMMGLPLEMVEGTGRVCIIYQLGVMYGAMNCANVSVYSVVVGASGGVYCLLGMVVANLTMNWDEMKNGLVCNHWFVLFFLVGFIGLDIYQSIWSTSPTSSYAAHTGGASLGFGLGNNSKFINNDQKLNSSIHSLRLSAQAFLSLQPICFSRRRSTGKERSHDQPGEICYHPVHGNHYPFLHALHCWLDIFTMAPDRLAVRPRQFHRRSYGRGLRPTLLLATASVRRGRGPPEGLLLFRLQVL